MKLARLKEIEEKGVRTYYLGRGTVLIDLQGLNKHFSASEIVIMLKGAKLYERRNGIGSKLLNELGLGDGLWAGIQLEDI